MPETKIPDIDAEVVKSKVISIDHAKDLVHRFRGLKEKKTDRIMDENLDLVGDLIDEAILSKS
jgi:hypothetical protein